jgi:hypothetical protein
MNQIPSAAEWLNTCGAAASKDWKAGWNDLRAHVLSGVFTPCPESGKHCRWVEGECQTCGITAGVTAAPTFSQADVEEAAKHCGISDGHRDLLAHALRDMHARGVKAWCTFCGKSDHTEAACPTVTSGVMASDEVLPRIEIELPDGDTREAKVWWTEKTPTGFRVSITVRDGVEATVPAQDDRTRIDAALRQVWAAFDDWTEQEQMLARSAWWHAEQAAAGVKATDHETKSPGDTNDISET